MSFIALVTKQYFNAKFICWWSIIWAVALALIAPIVNYLTPFLNPDYNNQWTPDVFYRLILYWHGMIFLPWVVVLATLIYIVYGLDSLSGIVGKSLRAFLFVGGFIAVPLAGIGSIFNVTDSFALGIPHWTESTGFAFLDLIAISLIIGMIVYPRVSGKGYDKIGVPYYVVFAAVVGAFIAGFMGYVGAYITITGPSPPLVANYINSTMYPALGFYNQTAVITFAENAITSHSHAMLPLLMAGVVALTSLVYGYNGWPRREKFLSVFGFLVMSYAMIATVWIYLVSGVGNYSTPTLFASGPNGIAEDDLITGIVGFGAFFVLIALLLFSRKGKTKQGSTLIRDPLFLSVIVSWILIYLTIPVTGYYIELNQSFYSAAGSAFDVAFTRFHQDFAFYVLPILVTTVLVFEAFGISGKARKRVGYLFLSGEIIIFFFGELYAMVTLNPIALYVATFGGALVALGALVGAEYLRKTGLEAPINWQRVETQAQPGE